MQTEFLLIGINELAENIKILLYKERENIFEYLDFEENYIYQEPLLFAYFNNKQDKKTSLDSIIYGYIDYKIRPEKIEVYSDDNGRIYLPNLGWIKSQKKSHRYVLNKNPFGLIDNGHFFKCEVEPLSYIKGTNIQILKYPLQPLNQFYYDEHLNRVNVEITNVTNKHIEHITTALNILKKYIPNHYRLINYVTKNIVIFNVDTNLRNSFATLNAQGIAFLNAYQEEYNEIFFIDDIAHQTGHIIFNALIYSIKNFIKVDASTIVQEIKNLNGEVIETRDIHVVFHALYTYYSTFICLDALYDARIFKNEKEDEILGRIKFYLSKCILDIELIKNNSNVYFTINGLEIFNSIKEKYNFIYRKYNKITKSIRLENQLYNFTISRFKELNHIASSKNC